MISSLQIGAKLRQITIKLREHNILTMHATKKLLTILTTGACALVFTAPRANAVGSLTLFDGFTTISVLDNSGLDGSPVPGVIVYNGVIGIWDINVSTGLTKPIIGSPSDPQMDLNSVDHSTGPGFLKITFVDDGFIATAGTVTAAIGGTQANGTTQFSVYQNLNQLTDSGTLTTTPFTSTVSGPLTAAAPYSLTEEVIINHTAAGTTSWDASLSVTLVPEGETVFAILGLATVAGAFTLRRRLSPA